MDPFNTSEDDKQDEKEGDTQDKDEKEPGSAGDTQNGDKDISGTDHDQGDHIAGNAAPTSVTGKRGPGTHPTEAGAQEQAATTAPEGTDEAERQRKGEVVEDDKQIDEASNKKPKTD